MSDFSPDVDSKKLALQKIIEMVTQHSLGGLKKKGEPDLAVTEIKTDKSPEEGDPLEELSESPDEEKSEDSGLLEKLLEHYGKDEGDEGSC